MRKYVEQVKQWCIRHDTQRYYFDNKYAGALVYQTAYGQINLSPYDTWRQNAIMALYEDIFSSSRLTKPEQVKFFFTKEEVYLVEHCDKQFRRKTRVYE